MVPHPPQACSDEGAGTSREATGTGPAAFQIWVPDVRSPSFRKQAHRQSLAVAASSHARKDQAFIVSDLDNE